MKFKEELKLLIKSRYSLVWIETQDEDYVTSNITEVSSGYKLYFWSVTKGLWVGGSSDSFYDSNEPVKALKLIADIIKDSSEALFVLYDIDKYFDKPIIVRYIKDILSNIKNNSVTLIGISPNPLNIKDFDNYVYRITGAFPSEEEIVNIVNSEISNFLKSSDLRIYLDRRQSKRFIEALKGLTEKQIRNIVLKCLVDDFKIDISDISKVEKVKKEIFDRSGFLEYYEGEVVEDIAGFNNLKKWIYDRKKIIDSDSKINIPSPKGVLLTGIPGCGKSLSAKVIGKILEYPIYRFDPSSVYSKYIGESEENVRKIFETIDRLSPVCLWIDEIEKIFFTDDSSSDAGVSKRIFSMFLVWFGERKNKTFVVATSNNIEKLPPEFIRKGRFDEIFFSDLPDFNERMEIFKIHFRKRGINYSGFDLKKLSEMTEGFSGSEIEQAVLSSVYSASLNVGFESVVSEIKKTTPLSVIKNAEFEAMRKWALSRNIPKV
ncbi:MAG: AAA family ATPase [Elusimicrobiota bacterium]